MTRKVSDSTVRRISHYVRALERSARRGAETVSSRELAAAIGTTPAQVRKDLSLFGSFGKRGLGYPVVVLTARLRAILGVDRTWRVALVGAGRIGAALFEYAEFRTRGFDIVAILDSDPSKIGGRWGDLTIQDVEDLEEVLGGGRVELIILAVPEEAAREIAARAVALGVRGVLNFAPTQLGVPKGVAVQNVNMVMELEALSFDLTHRSDG